jgi:hypothetical protein
MTKERWGEIVANVKKECQGELSSGPHSRCYVILLSF